MSKLRFLFSAGTIILCFSAYVSAQQGHDYRDEPGYEGTDIDNEGRDVVKIDNSDRAINVEAEAPEPRDVDRDNSDEHEVPDSE